MKYWRDVILAEVGMGSFILVLALGLIANYIDPIPTWLLWFGRGVGGVCVICVFSLGVIYMNKIRAEREVLKQQKRISRPYQS
jgi:hypothetical protein